MKINLDIVADRMQDRQAQVHSDGSRDLDIEGFALFGHDAPPPARTSPTS